LNGANSDLVDVDNVLYGTTYNGGTYGGGSLYSFPLSAVPEPATAAWGLAALAGLALRRGRIGKLAQRP
jgi:uncharacterized repeat protein (TIGR03803 family)